MAGINRRELRRRIGQTIRLRGMRALAADFTATSGSTTTIVNAAVLGQFPSEATYLNDARASVVIDTTQTTNQGITRAVDMTAGTPFARATGTLTTTAFPAAINSSSQVELWRFGLDADVVNRAINIALDEIDTQSLVFTQSTILGTELNRYEYPMPTALDYLYRVQIANKAPITGNYASDRTTGRALWDVDANTRLARKVVFSTREPVGGYLLHLSKTASPNVTLTVELQTNSSGLPSGTVVTGSAATLASTSITAPQRYYWIPLSNPISVDDGTYHLVLRSSQSALDATNYVTWSEDADSPDDENLERYSGSAWSAVTGSDVIFQILPSLEGDWIDWPPSGWDLLRDSTKQLQLMHNIPIDVGLGWYPEIVEGRPIRLFGYRDADEPASDTAAVEANPNYVMTEAILYLLTSEMGGPGVDPDAHEKEIAVWTRRAEQQRLRRASRTKLLPNTVRVTDRYL